MNGINIEKKYKILLKLLIADKMDRSAPYGQYGQYGQYGHGWFTDK